MPNIVDPYSRSQRTNPRFLSKLERQKKNEFGKTQTWGNLLKTQQGITMLGETRTRETMFGETQPNLTLYVLKFNLNKYTDYDEEYPEPPKYDPIEGSKVKYFETDPTLQRIVNSLLVKPKKISDIYVLNISKKFNGYHHTYIYDTSTGFSFWSTYYPPDGFSIAKISMKFNEEDPQGPLIPEFRWEQLGIDDGAFGIRNHKKKSKRRKKKTKRHGKKSKKKTKKRRVGKKRVVGKKSNKKGNVSGKKRRGVKRARTRRRSRV